MFDNMINTKELPMPIATLLGLALLMASYVSTGGLDLYFIVGMTAFFIALYVVCAYLQSKGKYSIDKRYDERMAKNTALAARNGYLVALVAVGATALICVSEQGQKVIPLVFSSLFVLLILVHGLSYAYYTDRDLT